LQEIQKLKEEMLVDLQKENIRKSRDEILPLIWENLNEAVGRINSYIGPFKTYPNFNKMDLDDIQDFFKDSNFPSAKVFKLIEAKDRNEYYLDVKKWIDLGETERVYNTFHNSYIIKKIFLDDELNSHLEKIDSKLNEIIISMKIQSQQNEVIPEMFISMHKKFDTEVNSLLLIIKDLIQKRINS
jgi:hypothetical protein